MYGFSHGYHGQRYCSWARTHDGGVAQHGGHTPNNRLTETCSLGLPCTSLILDIPLMINWHLSKQGICWPVSCDHIAGSSLQLIEVTCSLKLTADQVLVFRFEQHLAIQPLAIHLAQLFKSGILKLSVGLIAVQSGWGIFHVDTVTHSLRAGSSISL